MMKKYSISLTCAGLLILLMSYAAVSKLLVLPEFRGQMLNQNLPRALALLLVLLIPAAEILVCGLLWAPASRRYGFLAASLLLGVFSTYIALVILGAWSRTPCSCGGVIGRLSWTAHFWFNMIFLAAGVIGWRTTPRP